MGINRRLFPRYQVRLDGEIRMDHGICGVKVVEISLFGTKTLATQPIRPGSKVSITIDLLERIQFEGKVLWVLDKSIENRSLYILGIETRRMAMADKEAIGLTERGEMIQEILYSIKEKEVLAAM
jgi:hypothetical protein